MRADSQSRPPRAREVRLIEVAFLRGEGNEDDPLREVTAYYSMEGEFLAERDPSSSWWMTTRNESSNSGLIR